MNQSPEPLWKPQDLADFLQVDISWVYERTAPNSKASLKIPRVPGIGKLRFDPAQMRALFSGATHAPSGSLTSKSEKNLQVLDFIQSHERKRHRI